jgi:hypothetical protein
MDGNLLNYCAFETCLLDTTGTSLSTGTTSTRIIDTRGYDGVCYVGLMNSSDATAKSVGIKLYHGDSSGTFYLCTTAAAAIVTSSSDTKGSLVVLDVNKPVKRWHSIYAYRLTEGSRINIIAIKYKGKEFPVSQNSTQYGVHDSRVAVSPTS